MSTFSNSHPMRMAVAMRCSPTRVCISGDWARYQSVLAMGSNDHIRKRGSAGSMAMSGPSQSTSV